MKWFRLWWWRYVIESWWTRKSWTNFWCRLNGHKCGPWFYNVGGTEPDWRCKNCDENLG